MRTIERKGDTPLRISDDEEQSGTHVRYTDKTYPASGEKWLDCGQPDKPPPIPPAIPSAYPTAELRFVLRPQTRPDAPALRILQQRWTVPATIDPTDGEVQAGYSEWRDVPLVVDGELP